MTGPKPGSLAIVLAFGCAALLAAACDEKKPPSAPSGDAGVTADKYATADPKLEKALQAVAAASPADDKGPPPSGIFAPGAADKRHPKGMPTKVDVLNDGAEPRIDLGGSGGDAAAADPVRTSYGPAMLEVVRQIGNRSSPKVDLGLDVGPAKKDDGGPEWLVATIAKAGPAAQGSQLGQLAPGTEQTLASLQGSVFRMKLAPTGAASDLQVELGKKTPSELDGVVQEAAEAFVFTSVPLPSKPVGVDAQWIAESRMPYAGLDAIVYRAYRVKSISDKRVHLSLTVKAYAAGTDTKIPGLPKEAKLEEVEAQGEGEMELVRGEVLARESDAQESVVLTFETPSSAIPQGQLPPDQPQPPAGTLLKAQLPRVSQATFVRGDDLREALKGSGRP